MSDISMFSSYQYAKDSLEYYPGQEKKNQMRKDVHRSLCPLERGFRVAIGSCRISSDLATCLSKSMRVIEREFFDIPEKTLLLAILDRATRDVMGTEPKSPEWLSSQELRAKKDALAFFRYNGESKKRLTFPDICGWLNINRVEFLSALRSLRTSSELAQALEIIELELAEEQE
jgi:hypothetical protein